MKILLLGANGQVGWELQRSLAPHGELKACNRYTADLEDLDQLSTIIRDFSPKIIVNAAAYTAVDKAESEPDKAHRINAEAVGLVAQETKRLDAWMIHYSTDYVFDGNKTGAYTEADRPNPQCVYGVSKLQGDEAVYNSGCKHLIFRTSWVFANRGTNFPKTMLRLAEERDHLEVIADQFGAPTSAELIADVTSLCLHQTIHDKAFAKEASGTYHLTSGGKTSWHGFAQFVIAEAQSKGAKFNVMPESIEPISTAEYPLAAKRPANSLLSTQKLANTFGVYLPPWQIHAKRWVAEFVSQEIK